MSAVIFTIPGLPQQQGSKKHVGNGVMIEANKGLAPWREVALSRAREAKPKRADDGPVFIGPVYVSATFYFPRPKSHYGTGKNARMLKDTAPRHHIGTPDLDKLQRALGDILTQSQVIRDDRLICIWEATKAYGDPHVFVQVDAVGEW